MSEQLFLTPGAAADLFGATLIGDNALSTTVLHPNSSSSWDDFARYSVYGLPLPDGAGDLGLLSSEVIRADKLEFENCQPGDAIFMQGDEHSSVFVISGKPKINGSNEDLQGTLFIDAGKRDQLGGPRVYTDVLIHGSSMFGSTVLEALVQGLRPEVYMPYASMGPLLHEREMKGEAMLFLDPVVRISKGKPQEFALPAETVRTLERFGTAPPKITPVLYANIVADDLFAPIGVRPDDITAMFYRTTADLGEAVRFRYYVNPENGLLFKFGHPTGQTVWDFAGSYAEHYQSDGYRFHAVRAALFTYWGLRAGVTPTAEATEALASVGIVLP